MSSMLEICSEMISIRDAIVRQLCALHYLIQCALSIAPSIEMQNSNIELNFTKYSNTALQYFAIMIPYSSKLKLFNLLNKGLI